MFRIGKTQRLYFCINFFSKIEIFTSYILLFCIIHCTFQQKQKTKTLEIIVIVYISTMSTFISCKIYRYDFYTALTTRIQPIPNSWDKIINERSQLKNRINLYQSPRIFVSNISAERYQAHSFMIPSSHG